MTPKHFGLIGKTLKHSFSKNYFLKKFAEEGIADCSYSNFELPSIDAITELLASNPDIVGLNVTMPYKEQVLSFLDHKTEIVEKIKACNCIKIVEGELKGYNTDVKAFQDSIQKKLKPQHKSALILGSGGASKAVQYALNEMGIEYLIVSRQKEEGELGYEDLGEECIKEHLIIINTTPLGLYPNINADPPIPYEDISRNHILFDLIYNPEKTRFLLQGEKQGATIMNGYEMLVMQAEESWKIWSA